PYGSSNTYTDTSGSSLGTSLVQTAYDRYVEFALRAVPLIRDVADKRPVQQAMPGSSVVFQLYTDLAKATTPLSETVDPDAIGFGNTTSVPVTLAEYGNASLATRKLELFSLSDVDPAIADIIAFNMADSIDEVALTELRSGTNVIYGDGTSTASVTQSGGVITSADMRKVVAKLRTNKAVPRVDDLYWCGIHPEVSHDLRAETGAGAWRDAHIYNESGAGQLWPGAIGVYEGAMYVESPRLYSGVVNGVQTYEGATTATTYTKAAASGASGAFTIVFATAIDSAIQVGYVISGTNTAGGATAPGSGVAAATYARITAISADRLTITVDLANTGAVGTNTITFTATAATRSQTSTHVPAIWQA
ncbi:MAG: N4-gp56 family major capsid protein, partial [Betaproteobacteria bacterium]|nr:N4-gp56 family major capsid protein [Betaproteobacteria bacterium]